MNVSDMLGLVAIGTLGGTIAGVLIYEGVRWVWTTVRGAK